jgi:hypothetical protein
LIALVTEALDCHCYTIAKKRIIRKLTFARYAVLLDEGKIVVDVARLVVVVWKLLFCGGSELVIYHFTAGIEALCVVAEEKVAFGEVDKFASGTPVFGLDQSNGGKCVAGTD